MYNAALNILLLEDNAADAELLQELLLERNRFEVQITQVERLSQALKQLSDRTFDVVLSDLSLPDARGLEAIAHLHATAPDVPIIVMTGLDNEAVGLEALRRGAQDYLVKGQIEQNLIIRTIRYAIERSRTQQIMRRQAAAMAASRDGIAILDRNEEFIYLNESYAKIYGCDRPDDLIGTSWKVLYEQLAPEIDCTLQQQNHWHGEVLGKRGNGEFFYQALSFTTIGKDGSIVTVRDITERKQAEERLKASLKEKEILLKEIHHRVKNNLQVVSSLLKLQSGYVEDANILPLLTDSYNRVRSMALIHEKLYQSQNLAKIDAADYIQNLTKNLFRSYAVPTQSITLELRVSKIWLDVDTAVPCGLAINELVSNALKYAFPERTEGKIWIEFFQREATLTLIVGDNGVGLPPNFNIEAADSLGLQLVINLTEQLGGQLEIIEGAGAVFKITFCDRPPSSTEYHQPTIA